MDEGGEGQSALPSPPQPPDTSSQEQGITPNITTTSRPPSPSSLPPDADAISSADEVRDYGPGHSLSARNSFASFPSGQPPPLQGHSQRYLSRRGSRRASSASLTSIEDVLGVSFQPVQPPDESTWWFHSKWIPRYELVEKLIPQEVKEVEFRYKRIAYLVYCFALFCFCVYSVALIAVSAHKRNHPPTRVTATTGVSWTLPNMAVCLDPLKGFHHPMQSGYIKGYKSLDGVPTTDRRSMEKLAMVLDTKSCNNTANMSCFWINFGHYAPLDITAAVPDKQMIMDIIYFPTIKNQTEAEIWPVHQAAFISFTDLSVEEWCKAEYKTAMRNRYAVPTSFLSNDTFRTYNFLTKVTRQSFYAKERGLRGVTAAPEVYYGLRSQYTPVTFATRMVYNFTWYVPCDYRETDIARCQEDLQDRLDYAKDHVSNAEGILLTFIQDDSVTEYVEVDPFSILEMFGSIGGFWTYVLGAFTLMFVTNESGKRTLHFIFRTRTWRRWLWLLRWEIWKLWYRCSRCRWGDDEDLRATMRKRRRRRRRRRDHKRHTPSTSQLLEELKGPDGSGRAPPIAAVMEEETKEDHDVNIDIVPSPVRPQRQPSRILPSLADVATQLMGRMRRRHGSSNGSFVSTSVGGGGGGEGEAVVERRQEEQKQSGDEEDEEEEEEEEVHEYSSSDEDERHLEVALEERVAALERILKHVMKAPLILEEERMRMMASTSWRGSTRQEDDASGTTDNARRSSPGSELPPSEAIAKTASSRSTIS